jgi:hypothetical protein
VLHQPTNSSHNHDHTSNFTIAPKDHNIYHKFLFPQGKSDYYGHGYNPSDELSSFHQERISSTTVTKSNRIFTSNLLRHQNQNLSNKNEKIKLLTFSGYDDENDNIYDDINDHTHDLMDGYADVTDIHDDHDDIHQFTSLTSSSLPDAQELDKRVESWLNDNDSSSKLLKERCPTDGVIVIDGFTTAKQSPSSVLESFSPIEPPYDFVPNPRSVFHDQEVISNTLADPQKIVIPIVPNQQNPDPAPTETRPMLTSSSLLSSTFLGLSSALKNRFTSATNTSSQIEKLSSLSDKKEGLILPSEITQHVAEINYERKKSRFSDPITTNNIQFKDIFENRNGKSNRITTIFIPNSLLCKRFNVAVPDVAKNLNKKSNTTSVTNREDEIFKKNVGQYLPHPHIQNQSISNTDINTNDMNETSVVYEDDVNTLPLATVDVSKSVFMTDTHENNGIEEEEEMIEEKRGDNSATNDGSHQYNQSKVDSSAAAEADGFDDKKVRFRKPIKSTDQYDRNGIHVQIGASQKKRHRSSLISNDSDENQSSSVVSPAEHSKNNPVAKTSKKKSDITPIEDAATLFLSQLEVQLQHAEPQPTEVDGTCHDQSYETIQDASGDDDNRDSSEEKSNKMKSKKKKTHKSKLKKEKSSKHDKDKQTKGQSNSTDIIVKEKQLDESVVRATNHIVIKSNDDDDVDVELKNLIQSVVRKSHKDKKKSKKKKSKKDKK